ncbi:MAG TPA: hypothetical protein VFS96_01895 [Nitrolancea sp.]|nr:hypothetical protein [Nitrolancea sp.]
MSTASSTHASQRIRVSFRASYLGMGGILVLLGLAAGAHFYRATFPPSYVMEATLGGAGISLLVLALCEERYSRGVPLLLIALLYLSGSVGLLLIPEVVFGTVQVAAALLMIAAGILRILLPLPRAPRGSAGLGASGVIAILAGIAVLLGWPGKAIWALGVILALDLLIMGLGLVAFAIGATVSTTDSALDATA